MGKEHDKLVLKCTKQVLTDFCQANGIITPGQASNVEYSQKTVEFPLIKGKGVYAVTKGFADIIFQFPISYQENPYDSDSIFLKIAELFIEVKTHADLSDLGGILRQINEYKTYYTPHYYQGESNSSVLNWKPNWINLPVLKNKKIGRIDKTQYFCLFVNDISEYQKEFFEENDIMVFCYESVHKTYTEETIKEANRKSGEPDRCP